MKRLNSYKQNVLLVKDDVGRPKPCTRRLPGDSHTFGKAEIRDLEDAGKVASRWHYSQESSLKMQDKDFKRLNKSALGMRATTSHQQYQFRQEADIRIRHPSQIREAVQKKASHTKGHNNLGTLRYGGTGRQHLKKMAPPIVIPSDQDENFVYGAPLKPGTPMKAVLGNFYGEIAGYEHQQKTSSLRFSDEHFRKQMLNPPKSHTRASAMANTFVNTATVKKQVEAADQAKSLFKMKKFMAVEPRTSSKNPEYKPAAKRSNTAMRTASRPNPIFGGGAF